jgi:hypothetical protein
MELPIKTRKKYCQCTCTDKITVNNRELVEDIKKSREILNYHSFALITSKI